ncbi:hypothetical protein [Desulfosarcina ovata]|uniref:Type 4 fimbrial biogenesis protein PilX N-terminal domain-containing protein n=2 Tax=Desulfosarcina ovata TaxID=83564 RepID=A0A5K8ANR6_9BACT|nr:hypothetical protein [Desulfosarcina ovata]BBO86333.1 hypothetical protein DSCO28_68990 [Desulfosarcina ovata subsp. sediminis]BBO93274.1 hypothetical protein DSCOOX_64540 [Desulfosarcina ovata subsp. ovata]
MISRNAHQRQRKEPVQGVTRHVDNPEGSAIILAVLLLLILTLGGIIAIDYSNVELKYTRNDIERKQLFYYSESAGHEVAYDVDKTTTNDYAILDTATPIIVTQISAGTRISNPTATQVTNYTDTAWPVNTGNADLGSLTDREYAYRVYYIGLGQMPKGFGADFSSFVYDISTRVQETTATGIEIHSAAIAQGFRKIGPKS